MFVVDANVLLYATNATSPKHGAAREWLESALRGEGGQVVGLAWNSLIGFLRIATHPRLSDHPLSVERATDLVETWVSAPHSVIVEPTTRHLHILSGLLRECGTAGNLTNDAHLAALCVEYGATMVTYDHGFARFGIPTLQP